MRNPFKAALARREPQIGLWLSMAIPYTRRGLRDRRLPVAADRRRARAQRRAQHARAIAGRRAVPGAPGGARGRRRPGLIKQLLDIGAQTLLVPMVDTPEQAARARRGHALSAAGHARCRRRRGARLALGRAARLPATSPTTRSACWCRRRRRPRSANLEAICAVDGVHGVFIGPADLAASMGHRGTAGASRGAGGDRTGHPDHRRQRQGRRHADRRYRSWRGATWNSARASSRSAST